MDLDGKTILTPPPFVEVELVYEPVGRAGVSGRGWCALRLVTKNNEYDLDWSMRCFRVASRESGVEIQGHRLIGAVLTGGQFKDGDRLELTYPLPRPGVAAVFEVPGDDADYVTTSEVLRVVLRMRVLSVSEQAAQPQWTELSSSFRPAGPHGTRPGHGDPVPR
jgi:hypothetical protein